MQKLKPCGQLDFYKFIEENQYYDKQLVVKDSPKGEMNIQYYKEDILVAETYKPTADRRKFFMDENIFRSIFNPLDDEDTIIKNNVEKFLKRYIEASNLGLIKKDVDVGPNLVEYNVMMGELERNHKPIYEMLITQFNLRKLILKNNRANMAINDYNNSISQLLEGDPKYSKLLKKLESLYMYSDYKNTLPNRWTFKFKNLYEMEITSVLTLVNTVLYFDEETEKYYIIYEGNNLQFLMDVDQRSQTVQEDIAIKLNDLLQDCNCLTCSWILDDEFKPDDFYTMFGLDELRLMLKKQLFLLSKFRPKFLELFTLIVDATIIDIRTKQVLSK